MLYIAARAPRPGFAKTRLGRAIGQREAATLYAAFLRDLACRFGRAASAKAGPTYAAGWYVTPPDAWADLAPLVTVGGQHGRVLAQPEGDWAERQRALFAEASARGERRTVLIASDSPHLGPEVVAAAFARLRHDDLVLGPTDDGGYYLIGMNVAAGRRAWEVLAGVRMSTGTVLDELLVRAATLGLRAGLLPATFDIDEYGDLDRLLPLARGRGDLAATRAALGRLGLLGRGEPGAGGSGSAAETAAPPGGGGRPDAGARASQEVRP